MPNPVVCSMPLPRLLVDAGLCKTTSEARRLIEQGAVRIAGHLITDPTSLVMLWRDGDQTRYLGAIPKRLADQYAKEVGDDS
ncbi:MAG TPA: S4 domain-containing protein [Phycisphaerae bacterium]|nr:S4 domain-containing protein [Phycisphaerae bacterium]